MTTVPLRIHEMEKVQARRLNAVLSRKMSALHTYLDVKCIVNFNDKMKLLISLNVMFKWY